MSLISRAEAQRRGLTHYHTGKPCSNGHYSTRYTVNGGCKQCITNKSLNFKIRKQQDFYFKRATRYLESIRPVDFLGDEYIEEYEALLERMKYIGQLRTVKKFHDDKATAHLKLRAPRKPKPKTTAEHRRMVAANRTEFRKP